MKTIKITDGVNLRLIEGNKFDRVTMALLFRIPAEKKYVTADTLLSIMLLSGSSRFKDRRMLEIRLEELDGAILDTSVIKKGSEHIIQLYASFKPCHTVEMFRIISDIVFKPLFRCEYAAKNSLKNIIEGQLNNKRTYAFNRFMEEVYNDINGDGYIDKINEIDIHRHYKYVIDNSVVEIMTVGGSEGDITEAVRKYMSFLPRKESYMPLKKLTSTRKSLIENDNIVQGKLCVGIEGDFNCKGKDYAKLLVANDIFGAGSDSMLFNEAREKENLCYYISSRIFRFSSLICVEAGIDSKNMEKTVEIVKDTLDKIRNSKISSKKTDMAKQSVINGYRAAVDKPAALLNIYLNQIMASDERNIDEIIDCIKSVDNIDGVFDGFDVEAFYMLRGDDV